jgi:amino acid permease
MNFKLIKESRYKSPGRLATVSFSLLMLVIVGVVAYLYLISNEKHRLTTAYKDRIKTSEYLYQVSKNIHQSRLAVRVALGEAFYTVDQGALVFEMDSDASSIAALSIERNVVEISELWKAYIATGPTKRERVLANICAAKIDTLVVHVLTPVIGLLRDNNYENIKLYPRSANSPYIAAQNSIDELIKYRIDNAKTDYDSSMATLQSICKLAVGILIFAAALLISAVYVFLHRAYLKP